MNLRTNATEPVKTVPYSVNVNVKNFFTSHIDKKNIFDIFLYTVSLYEHASLIIVSVETEYISTRYWYRNINFL